jgi:hypothetical protein
MQLQNRGFKVTLTTVGSRLSQRDLETCQGFKIQNSLISQIQVFDLSYCALTETLFPKRQLNFDP